MNPERVRLTIVVSHPIQYQAPLYRRLARSSSVEPLVLFLSDHGVSSSFDAGFGQRVAYDVPLLDGYEHQFLRNRAPRPNVSRFDGLVNPSLLSRIDRRSTDVVLVHGWGHASEWMALANCAARGIPYLLRGEARADGDAALSRARAVLKRAALRPLVSKASGCLAIGRYNREFYLEYGASEKHLFDAPYSVDTERFEEAGERGRAERRERLRALDLDPDLPVVLFAAKLQPWKRPLDVVRAVARLPIAVNLLFIGDGALRDELEAEAASLTNARVLGFVNQTDIGTWYGLSDVYVLPSDREPWGLAVNEAMSAGAVPVVSDVVGCVPDLVTAETGRTFPVGDVDGLAGALGNVLSRPPELREMSEAAAAKANEFSIEATARGIEEAAIAAASDDP